MGLLQRLASVGLGGRREEIPDPASDVRRAAPLATPPQRPGDRLPLRAPPRPPESPRAEPVSEYARRPSHQGLDQHGRAPPVHNSVEEDQLDIPAFLRRQTN